MVRRFLSSPLGLLLLATVFLTALIQSGELGTSDSTHRLQVAHSLWTHQPQVFPSEYPEFGIHGRNGRLYAWYGMGQSLLLLPFDLLGTWASHWEPWRAYVATQADPAIRSVVVSIGTNVLVNVLTALAAFRLLVAFRFTVPQTVTGVACFLCGTTHLHYAQNMTENNYILLLTLTGWLLEYRWLQTRSRTCLVLGSAALGLNLLTRLTTGLDLLAGALFLALAAGPGTGATMRSRWKALPIRAFVSISAPVTAFFLLLDRVYQYLRFGSWTSTYVSGFAREQRLQDPSLPANFPFNGHAIAGGVHSGLLGPLLAPEKSIFLFDPLIILAILVTIFLWKRMGSKERAFELTVFALLVAYIAFYARYLWWAGDFAWGDRYIASAVELATLLAVPLLMRHRRTIPPLAWNASWMLVGASVVVQFASLAFWLPLEIYQEQDFGRPTWVVWLRFRNIAAQLLHRQAAWGLQTPAMFEDPWDAAHITTWNVLPALLRHVGVAPPWAVHAVDLVWLVLGLLFLLTAARLLFVVRRGYTDPSQQTL